MSEVGHLLPLLGLASIVSITPIAVVSFRERVDPDLDLRGL
jgi:hypothetical protein